MKMNQMRKIMMAVLTFCISASAVAQKAKRKPVPQKKKTEVVAVNQTTPKTTEKKPESNEFKWYGFEEGYKKAVATNKILLVDAYTDWCGWCKVMDRETYSDQTVIAALEKDFVCVKFNPEIDKNYVFGDRTMDGRTLLLWLGHGESGGFPTTYFWLNPNKDDRRFNQPGYYPPAEFLKLLDTAILNRDKTQ